MDLDGKEIEALAEALKGAFRTRRDFERLTRFELNLRLDEIVGEVGLDDVAFELVSWAESNGKLPELIGGARHRNRGNATLEEVATRLLGEPSPSTPHQQSVRAALGKARDRQVALDPEDHCDEPNWEDIIVKFDLVDQETSVRKHLAGNKKNGALAFAVRPGGYTEDILKGYVLKRVEEVIRADARKVKHHEIYLDADAIRGPGDGAAVIEQLLVQSCGCARLADIFAERGVDVLLVVWNRGLPLAQYTTLATAFWSAVVPQIDSATAGKSVRLIAFWADWARNTPQDFAILPALDPFDLDLLVDHFTDWLTRHARLTAAEMRTIDERLRVYEGRLPGTYTNMRGIVADLTRAKGATA